MTADEAWTGDGIANEFRQKGFAVARGALSTGHLQSLRRHAYRASLLLLGRLGRMDLAPRLRSRSIEQDLVDIERELPKFSVWLTINPFLTHDLLQIALSARLRSLAASLLGSRRVALHPFLAMRCKVPGETLHEVPWHQDSAYLSSLNGIGSIVTIWIPCVPTSPENGGLQISAASTHDGRELAHLPDVDQTGSWYLRLKTPPDSRSVRSISTEPGDIVAFRHDIPHRSLPNPSPTTRLSFDMRYHIDGTTNGTTQPSLALADTTDDETLSDETLKLVEVSRIRSFGYDPRAIPVRPPWFDRWRPSEGSQVL